MSTNRIQKLLFSEYCEFEDMVLIESPFAETTRDGIGIRQVHLGLTPTKLILATDVLPTANDINVWCFQHIDPAIETFELISVYPIECVNLSVFRKNKRQSLKAHFCNNRIIYFELGGFEKRKMFWNLWCERIKFLCPKNKASSNSETSVGSSTSNSTLYLTKTNSIYTNKKKPQLWCTFNIGNSSETKGKWLEKDLFLGNRIEQLKPFKIASMNSSINEIKTIYRKRKFKQNSQTTINSTTDKIHKYGIDLIIDDETKNNSIISNLNGSMTTYSATSLVETNVIELINDAVQQWEDNLSLALKQMSLNRLKHQRHYAFSPQPYFYCGLGPWTIGIGERYSVQTKRVVSMVSIRRQPTDIGLRLPISKRQLSSSISFDTLVCGPKHLNFIFINTLLDKSPFDIFWTPNYWYRPRKSRSAYQELQMHLKQIYKYQENVNKIKHFSFQRNYVKRKNILKKLLFKHQENKKKKLMKINENENNFNVTEKSESSRQYYQHLLNLNVTLTAWDFDSTTLAYQLTIIDRDLFLKITDIELSVLIWQQSSKNAPNICAIIAFAHRTSCLVTTEIVRENDLKM